MKKILFFLCLTIQCGFAQNYHYALDKAPENSDTQSPTSPLNLVANNITQTSVDLSWNMATDNVGVTLYRIYNDGNFISSNTENSYTLTGLVADTEYNLTVRAVDAAGNESDNSNTLTFKTLQQETNNCSVEYKDSNGLIVIEAENIDNVSTWTVDTSNSGYSGSGYLEWGQGNFFNNPGNGLITISLQINSTGIYKFQWRSKIGVGTNNTEDNDSWVRFPDASDNFATPLNSGENGEKIYPKGSGKTPNPEGSGSDNWWKVYTNSLDWNWQTRTSDNDPHDIYVQFNTSGIYTMEISARSNHHLLDRIVLSKSNVSNPTDLNLQETPCLGDSNDDNEAPTAPLNLIANNPTENTIDLTWDASTDNVGVASYRLYNNGSIINTPTITGTNYKLEGLTPDTAYNITVRAVKKRKRQEKNRK